MSAVAVTADPAAIITNNPAANDQPTVRTIVIPRGGRQASARANPANGSRHDNAIAPSSVEAPPPATTNWRPPASTTT